MTKKELQQLYYINREIDDIKNRIMELESDYLKATRLSGDRVQTSGNSDQVGDLACRIADLRNLYKLKLEELFIKKTDVERYIATISDPQIRSIFRLRHIDCQEWMEIAAALNYSDRQVRRKYSDYLNMSNNVR